MDKFKLFASWEICPLLDAFLWVSPLENRNLLKLCPVERKLNYICKDGIQYLFLEEGYWRGLTKWCAERENDAEFFQRDLRNFNAKAELVKRRIDSVTRVAPSQLSDDELATVYAKFVTEVNGITPFDQLGMIAEPIFTGKLSKILPASKIAAATMAPWPSTTVNEELAVVNAVIEIIEKEKKSLSPAELNAQYSHLLQGLAVEFGFIPVFLFNEPWGTDHYAEEINAKLQDGVEKLTQRKMELENFEQNAIEKAAQATAKIKESALPEIIQVLSFTRNEAELVLSYGNFKFRRFYREICKRLHISTTQLRFYTQDELVKAIACCEADVELLNRRIANGVGIYSNAKEWHFIEDKDIKTLLAGAKMNHVKNEMLCACPGTAKGKVRIVRNADDVREFKQGEVLVAKWTCVDFLPAMKKAAAFVTEGGGITCHAAVIARELNVPCIIGYKNATKVFQNGDEVEINAEKLTVRKK